MSVRMSEDLREVVFHLKFLPNIGNIYMSYKKVFVRGGEKILFRIFVKHKHGNMEDVFNGYTDVADIRELALKLLLLTSHEEKDWRYYIDRIKENLAQLQNILEVDEE